jgi:hypothetical protein
MTQFLAKYRGKVVDNQDPMSLGRIKASVPSVLGEDIQVWAMPCVPFAGKDVGLFLLPPRGANVWVEFEGGDLDYPIWSGCFWDRGELPADPAEEKMKVLKTDKVTMTLNDDPNEGGFFLEVGQTPLKMSFSSSGIEISNSSSNIKITSSKITIKGNDIEISNGPFNIKVSSSKVSINDGALEVV